ncbi:MAG: nicotinate-nucleotide--dimethylbenzimidazole phosphoribosyltransferase [bacterium]
MEKLNKTIENITEIDKSLSEKTQERLDFLTKPQGSLGRLEEFAKAIVLITGNENPSLKNKVIFTMAGDHGVAEEGVSAYPKEVTPQMVYNFIKGGAGINVLANHIGAEVVVVDMGVAEKLKTENLKLKTFVDKKINYGTKNIAKGPAMTRDEAISAICAGISVFEDRLKDGIDITGTGDMGIANTTPSSAIAASITGKPIEDVVGRGTGINDEMLENKIRVVERAISINKPNPDDGIDVLAKIGGFEIGGLAGIILASSSHKIPVVIDGFISTAACLIAYKISPKIKDYIFASHCSQEKGHRITLDYLCKKPILDLDMRLGEGTGAALAINIIDAGCKILTQMATFSSAGVSRENQLK